MVWEFADVRQVFFPILNVSKTLQTFLKVLKSLQVLIGHLFCGNAADNCMNVKSLKEDIVILNIKSFDRQDQKAFFSFQS